MNKLKRIAALALTATMLSTSCLAADQIIMAPAGDMGAMGAMPGGDMGGMGPMGPGGPMGPMGPGATTTVSGVQSVSEFLDLDNIQYQDELSVLIELGIFNGIEATGSYDAGGAEGVLIYSDDFAASGIALSGGDGIYNFGGEADFYTADDIAAVSDTAAEYVNRYAADESFNSAIILGAEDSSSGLTTAGNAITTDGGVLNITNAYLQTSGAIGQSPSGRYAAACVGTGATMVVNDSYVIHTGATEFTESVTTPPSNAGLLISGRGRANFSVGETDTYYYNSTVVAEGWAAMSTDSATGEGLDFVAYNSTAIAENGGYGVYSDTNCRDYLYAVTMSAAEIGAIVSNNGYVYIGSGADISPIELRFNTGATSDAPSVITAGRNDFQLHSPDMMGQGTAGYQAVIEVENSQLVTTTDLVSTEDYYAAYDEAVGKYIDYVSGANILVKSTGADITLNNVTAESYSGTLLLTALNSDSMSRYLKSEGYDVELSIANSTIEGDIVHDDYQRDLFITITGSDYTGAVTYSTCEEWNAMWADVADCEYNYWSNLDAATYITDTHATDLTLSGSTWNVTADSELTGITLDAASKVVVAEGAVLTVGGKTYPAGTYAAADFAGAPEAGVSEEPEIQEGGMGMPGMPGGDMGGMPGMPGMPGGDMGGMPGMPGGPDGGGEMSGAMGMGSNMPANALLYYTAGEYDAEKVADNGTVEVAAESTSYVFLPEDTLTRAQMSKIVACMLTCLNGEEQVGETVFPDTVDNWAKDYIAYCADNGILKGDDLGNFNPETLTIGYDLATVLLRAMGLEPAEGDWKTVTKAAAEQYGLLTGLDGIDLNAEITRDQAAKMVYNGLTLSTDGGVMPKVTVYTETQTLSELTLRENSIHMAPEGKAVVLTVDGVSQDMEPGVYTGNVVLSVVDLIEDIYYNHGVGQDQTMVAALYVDDTGILTEQSVTAALVGGSYDGQKAEGITITSNSESFGGIRVGGDAEYVIENCTFDLTGNGGNDFTGIGCAVSATDNAKVTIRNCVIKTEGALRGAFFVGDTAEIIVEDCDIHTKSLWADEAETELEPVTISTAGMTTPPTGLGVYGNNRANNLVDSGNATYVNCNIYADSWGAMGSDAVSGTPEAPMYMNLNGCYIEVGGSGYGAYSIGYIWDVFDDTDIVVDNGMGVIVAAEGSTRLKNGSTITSQRFGIVTHQGMGAVSNIELLEDSSITAKYTGIQIKERASNITISDGATITVSDGAMIHALKNDDTGAGSLQGAETVSVAIDTTELTGDIIQSLPGVPMTVTMENAAITGAVSTASYTYLNGGVVGKAQEVGIVTSYTTEVMEGAELSLTLTGATWNVVGSSYLTSLTFDASSAINGTITVNGEVVTAPGTYTGAIVVTE